MFKKMNMLNKENNRMNSKEKFKYCQMFEFYKRKTVLTQSLQDKVLLRLMLKISQTFRSKEKFVFEDTQWQNVRFIFNLFVMI